MTAVPPVSGLPERRSCGDAGSIVIGLVNNMPDAGLRSTERQFRDLLSATAPDAAVCLRLFSLPELPRSDAGRAHLDRRYEDISRLWASRLDGLIVTGTEPRALALTDEPYWPTLTKLVDWAEHHTVSAVWSCLAAHGAVRHLDGIFRLPLGGKLVGVFECTKAADHEIVFDAPPRWLVPHSRYNGLPEEALVAKGYRILSSSADTGADMFVTQKKSLFVFVQGHLEYDPGALFREYRRDVARFLEGTRNSYPEIPRNYFDDDTMAEFTSFRHEALRTRDINLLASFPGAVEGRLRHAWREPAVCIYANWLAYLMKRIKPRFQADGAPSSDAFHEELR
jgi:homoserine O-succinyltransferase/O-acetyltransferase